MRVWSAGAQLRQVLVWGRVCKVGSGFQFQTQTVGRTSQCLVGYFQQQNTHSVQTEYLQRYPNTNRTGVVITVHTIRGQKKVALLSSLQFWLTWMKHRRSACLLQVSTSPGYLTTFKKLLFLIKHIIIPAIPASQHAEVQQATRIQTRRSRVR